MSDKMLKFINVGQQTPPKRRVLARKDDFIAILGKGREEFQEFLDK